jgi:hypothetical protein
MTDYDAAFRKRMGDDRRNSQPEGYDEYARKPKAQRRYSDPMDASIGVVMGHMFIDGKPLDSIAPNWTGEHAVVPKPRIRLKTDQAGAVPASVFCVLLMGTGKRTMWYGAEIDAMRAAFRGEFTRTA